MLTVIIMRTIIPDLVPPSIIKAFSFPAKVPMDWSIDDNCEFSILVNVLIPPAPPKIMKTQFTANWWDLNTFTRQSPQERPYIFLWINSWNLRGSFKLYFVSDFLCLWFVLKFCFHSFFFLLSKILAGSASACILGKIFNGKRSSQMNKEEKKQESPEKEKGEKVRKRFI